jgi:hypothetical protein
MRDLDFLTLRPASNPDSRLLPYLLGRGNTRVFTGYEVIYSIFNVRLSGFPGWIPGLWPGMTRWDITLDILAGVARKTYVLPCLQIVYPRHSPQAISRLRCMFVLYPVRNCGAPLPAP